MSNKTQLQTNNASLDALISRVNAAKDTAASLPDAGSGGSSGVSVETCTMTIKSDSPVTAYFTLYRDGCITKDYFSVSVNTAQTVNDVIKNTLMFVTISSNSIYELDDYTGDGFDCIDMGTNWAVFTVWDYASTDDCYCELSWRFIRN